MALLPKKISELTVATSLTGDELIPIVQSSTNKTVTPKKLFGYIPTPTIKITTLNIPAINPGERVVVTGNLGVLTNPDRVLVQFVLAATSDTVISIGSIDPSFLERVSNTIFPLAGLVNQSYNISSTNLDSCLLVSLDYNNARRFNNRNQEVINTATQQGVGSTYSSIGTGVLVGWYSGFNTGAFSLNKKVQLESAWLSLSGTNSILNIAFKNVDSVANTAKNIKAYVYE